MRLSLVYKDHCEVRRWVLELLARRGSTWGHTLRPNYFHLQERASCLTPMHTVCWNLAARASRLNCTLQCFGLDMLLLLASKFLGMWSRTGHLLGLGSQVHGALIHSKPNPTEATLQREFWWSNKFQLMLLTRFGGYSESGNQRGHNVHPQSEHNAVNPVPDRDPINAQSKTPITRASNWKTTYSSWLAVLPPLAVFLGRRSRERRH